MFRYAKSQKCCHRIATYGYYVDEKMTKCKPSKSEYAVLQTQIEEMWNLCWEYAVVTSKTWQYSFWATQMTWAGFGFQLQEKNGLSIVTWLLDIYNEEKTTHINHAYDFLLLYALNCV